MGINAVPVVIIDDKRVIHGAPEVEDLQKVFSTMVQAA
jgi:predicted DsbA family dithiol-disulfide isomerase